MSEAVITASSIDPSRGSGGALISAVGVGREFATPSGVVEAVRDITLDIPASEFCVIVGPSGCGKSTLLRMMAGLDSPTSGQLTITSPSGGTPSNAVVFQGRSLFPWLNIRDNIGYGLKLNGIGKADREATTTRLLAVLGLIRFADAYPHQLSEGMRQRVAIGRALAVDPDLLLMDEPFGALDEQTRFILQEELLRIWESSGKTVVFITHSIDEALTLADRIVVMSAQPGTVRAIIDVPFSRPRSLSAVRSDPAFGALFNQTWDLLRDEVMRARQLQEGALIR
ncbi:MAG: ABC transporter ATP-binding protein [Chloroflexota bacterium]|nr:ABC transporter ATP-binding protein [Chloroflexota bacterium]